MVERESIEMNVKVLKGERGFSNTYIINLDSTGVIIIDPSSMRRIKQYLFEFPPKMCYVFLTHEHWDHIMGINQLRKFYKTQVVASRNCSERITNSKTNLSKYLNILYQKENCHINQFECKKADVVFEGSIHMEILQTKIDVFETPGHSLGSSCVKIGKFLFAGDTILQNKEDIFHMPSRDVNAYRTITMPRLEKLYSQDKDLIVYPGHGETMYMCDIINEIKTYVEDMK